MGRRNDHHLSVGDDRRLPDALGKHNVTRTDDCDALLDRLEQRAAIQREHRRYEVLSQHRIDPDLADPWAPEIVLVERPLTDEQRERLSALHCWAAQGDNCGRRRRTGSGCGLVAGWRCDLQPNDGSCWSQSGLALSPQLSGVRAN